MMTEEVSRKLYDLLERNEYSSDPTELSNLYAAFKDHILPYYDKSKFYLSNMNFAIRKIIAIDSVCKAIGEYEVHPIHMNEVMLLSILSDAYKVIDPFDRDITHASDIVEERFKPWRNYYFKNKDFYDELIESTQSKYTCNRILTKLVHDVNILVLMDPNWYICSAWHDFELINRHDLDEYNHGKPSQFKPSIDSDEILMKKLQTKLRSYNAGINNWHTLYVPELKANNYFQSRIKATENAVNDFDKFRKIIEDNEYILYRWPI